MTRNPSTSDRMPGARGVTPKAGSERLLTLREAAEYLRVSVWTVSEMVRSKQIGSVHVRTRHLIPRDEIERFLTEQYDPKGGTHD